jgi:hypothetical protein
MSDPAPEAAVEPQQPAATSTPAPKAVIDATGKPGETPEQTIAGLRAALAKANEEAKQSRLSAKEDFRNQMRELLGEQAEAVKPEDAVKTLRQEMDELRQENRLSQVARTFGITDENDLALLRSANTPDLMTAWAERLKPSVVAPAVSASPLPDPGQGARAASSVEDAEYDQFYPTNTR